MKNYGLSLKLLGMTLVVYSSVYCAAPTPSKPDEIKTAASEDMLRIVTEDGHVALVENPFPTAMLTTIICFASRDQNHSEIKEAREALDAGAKVNKLLSQESPIEGHPPVKEDISLLMQVIILEREDFVDLFLEYHANVNFRSEKTGATALSLAEGLGLSSIAEKLRKAGATK